MQLNPRNKSFVQIFGEWINFYFLNGRRYAYWFIFKYFREYTFNQNISLQTLVYNKCSNVFHWYIQYSILYLSAASDTVDMSLF